MQPPSFDWLQGFLLSLATPLGAVLGVTLALLVCRHYLLRWLEAAGLMAGLEAAPLPRRLAVWGTSLVAALVVLSVTIVVANALARGLQHIGQRVQIETAVTGLGTTLTRVLVFLLG